MKLGGGNPRSHGSGAGGWASCGDGGGEVDGFRQSGAGAAPSPSGGCECAQFYSEVGSWSDASVYSSTVRLLAGLMRVRLFCLISFWMLFSEAADGERSIERVLI